MQREFGIRDSKFNKLGLHLNWLGNVVYYQLNCTDEDMMTFNYDEERLVYKKIQPIVEYLSGELGWGDYLTMQVSNFVDEEGNNSLSYGILFIFVGENLTITKFIWHVIGWILGITTLAVGIPMLVRAITGT